MQIKRTIEAEDDLVDIYLYTFNEYGKSQAEKYIEELENAIQRIAESPKLYQERPMLSPAVRICPLDRHIILYMIQSDAILIIRVLHSRMDIEDHLTSNATQ